MPGIGASHVEMLLQISKQIPCLIYEKEIPNCPRRRGKPMTKTPHCQLFTNGFINGPERKQKQKSTRTLVVIEKPWYLSSATLRLANTTLASNL